MVTKAATRWVMGTFIAYFYRHKPDNSHNDNFGCGIPNLDLNSTNSWGQDGGLSKCLSKSTSGTAQKTIFRKRSTNSSSGTIVSVKGARGASVVIPSCTTVFVVNGSQRISEITV